MANVYSREQISQFLSYIKVPAKYRLENNPKCDHEFLKALHIHMITAIPYENLSLHYSPKRVIDIKPQFLFQKMVGDARGRGGYCLENSLLFLHMLRGLGFRAYPTGVKIRYREGGVPHGDFVGWVHIVNIVIFPDGSRWSCDVSFGGDGATEPIELREGATIRNMGTQDARLVRDFIPGQTELAPERKFWIYQCRNGEDKPWHDFYCFSDAVEWLGADFEIINCFTGHSAASFQTTNVLAIKFLRCRNEETGEEKVYGKRMLVNGLIKENLGGRTQLVQECKTEEERVKALREWFEIGVTDEEKEAIKGFQTEIKG